MKKLLLLLCVTLLFYSAYAQEPDNDTLTIFGTITYERPTVNKNHMGLNYNDKESKPAQQIVVHLLNESGDTIATTTTNDKGEYTIPSVSKNIQVKIRAYASMSNTSINTWDIKVLDNSNNNALYTVEGKLTSTKEHDNQRNIHIPLEKKISAPFSILHDIYSAMKKITTIEPTTFPPLNIYWSTRNNPSRGSLQEGQIGTSFFDGYESIYLLGDNHSDADEFDTHVIIHEWSHYFAHYFSREDTIGGNHGDGDYLDIRVAFSEGFGNAWSAIVTDNPIYSDTIKEHGWFMNIERDISSNAGWWSEFSVQKIIYDLYDKRGDINETDESHDQIALGVKPLYEVLTTTQKETKAFTSIFSFITLLKENNNSLSPEIDRVVHNEGIDTIESIYGETLHNLYTHLGEQEVCTSSQYGKQNKLLNHKYILFTIDTQKSYTVRVKQTNGDDADPDFSLYGGTPFGLRKTVESYQKGLETSRIFLAQGEYILDISDFNGLQEACFNVTIK